MERYTCVGSWCGEQVELQMVFFWLHSSSPKVLHSASAWQLPWHVQEHIETCLRPSKHTYTHTPPHRSCCKTFGGSNVAGLLIELGLMQRT